MDGAGRGLAENERLVLGIRRFESILDGERWIFGIESADMVLDLGIIGTISFSFSSCICARAGDWSGFGPGFDFSVGFW